MAVLAGVSIGCLCIGASVVWLLSRGMSTPPKVVPSTTPAVVVTPAIVAPAVDTTKPAPKAVETKDAAPVEPTSAKSEVASKASADAEEADEEAAKKPKRRHHRRKKE